MYDLKVNLGTRSYNILIEEGSIFSSVSKCCKILNRNQVWLVSDENVLRYYKKDLVDCFDRLNVNLNLLELPAGEQTKSFKYLKKLTEWLIETGIERNDLIIAFGGGVIGDLVGFASAITLRGINFAQIPTTLLAQVDSSVGGKTGINSIQGKNLLGCFHHPKQVLICTKVLKTLSRRELKAGYSEIIKYGILGDSKFFDWLEKFGFKVLNMENELLQEAIYKSCQIKAEIVSRDELENGERALLNLGHTFAHVLEAAVGYSNKLLHGEAVSIGIIIAAEISYRMNFCKLNVLERIREHFREIGLKSSLSEVDFSFPSTEGLIDLMKKDKKARNGKIKFIMMKDMGNAFITDKVDFSIIKDSINSLR